MPDKTAEAEAIHAANPRGQVHLIAGIGLLFVGAKICREGDKRVGFIILTGCDSKEETADRREHFVDWSAEEALTKSSANMAFGSAAHVRGFAAIMAAAFNDLATAMDAAEAKKDADHA